MRLLCITVLGLLAWAVAAPESPSTADAPAAPKKDAGPAPAPAAKPGDRVKWLEARPVKMFTDPKAGAVLSDIEHHVAAKHGTYYRDADVVTWGHESTHCVNNDLRNAAGQGVNAFYCLDNRYAVLKEPTGFRLHDAAAFVPQACRGHLMSYFSAGGWQSSPLYLLDEWTAYLNGAAVWVDQRTHGLPNREADGAFGATEFAAYGMALVAACEKLDPGYDAGELREYVAYSLRRAQRFGLKVTDATLLGWAEKWYGKPFADELGRGTDAPRGAIRRVPTPGLYLGLAR